MNSRIVSLVMPSLPRALGSRLFQTSPARAGVCEGGGYCEWGEIDRGTDYAGARSEYRVKLKNVDIAERLYYFTKTII